MIRIVVAVLAVAMVINCGISGAEAASKAKSKRWRDYNKEQRAEIMKRAREVCKKKYGAPSTVYKIDYYREKIWCWAP